MPRVIFISDKRHIPRYSTRKHCKTTLSHANIFGKFTGISENFGNASNSFLRNFYKRRIYENFGQSLAIFGNFWKTSETAQRCFPLFIKLSDFLKIFVKSSEIFGSVRKSSENFGDGSKVTFRCFYDFFKFSENLRKCSEIFGKFPDVMGNVRNGSQELKSFGAGF